MERSDWNRWCLMLKWVVEQPSWQWQKCWMANYSWGVGVLHNKAMLTLLRKMFPYILGKYQIGKFLALVDHIDSGWKNSLLFTRQKDARKGNTAGNYKPIACFYSLCKLLTGVIDESV